MFTIRQMKMIRSKKHTTMKTITLINGNLAKRISIVVIALLIGSGLFAQKSVGNIDFQQLTANLIDGTEDIIAAFSYSNEEVMIEEEVQFENWMINLEKWANKMDTVSKSEMLEDLKSTEAEFTEEQVEFESWMFESDWLKENNHHHSETSKSVNKEEIQLESWMSTPKEWLVAKSN